MGRFLGAYSRFRSVASTTEFRSPRSRTARWTVLDRYSPTISPPAHHRHKEPLPPHDHSFDPDAPAQLGSGLFGLDLPKEQCRVRVLGVPFDATTSYRDGAARGPQAILAASHQVDLFDAMQREWPGGDGRPWAAGIHFEHDHEIESWNREARPLAEAVIAVGGQLGGCRELQDKLDRVNAIGAAVNQRVHGWTREVLADGALPVILGGDHSVPFGAITAAAREHSNLGLLHIDAHADLRDAYEGFTWSHASILHNVLAAAPTVEQVVSVGLRDLGEREVQAIEDSGGRVRPLHDHKWGLARARGHDLFQLASRELDHLPEDVWLTIDVDGLDPALCPNTGTPVPGGLTWNEVMVWLEALTRSDKRVVGIDLCEVSPGAHDDPETDAWDAVVGSRLLYKLVGTALATIAQHAGK